MDQLFFSTDLVVDILHLLTSIMGMLVYAMYVQVSKSTDDKNLKEDSNI